MKKWEIKGEIFLIDNSYDMYSVIEPAIILPEMYRDSIIFKNKERGAFNKYVNDDGCLHRPLYLSTWVEEQIGLEAASEDVKYIGNKTYYSFQPQTKKVRITIEEIE